MSLRLKLKNFIKSLVFIYRCNTDEEFNLSKENLNDKLFLAPQMCESTINILYKIFLEIDNEIKMLCIENEDFNSCMVRSDGMLRYITLFANVDGTDFYKFKDIFEGNNNNKYRDDLAKKFCLKTIGIITAFIGCYVKMKGHDFSKFFYEKNILEYIRVLNSICEIKSVKLISI